MQRSYAGQNNMSLLLRDHDMRAEGRAENKRITVINMLKENMSMEMICRIAECDEVYVEAVRKEMQTAE